METRPNLSCPSNRYPIIAYKVSNITIKAIQKSNNLNHHTLIGLPNVFLNKRIFPELLLPNEITSDRIYQESLYFLDMEKEIRDYLMLNVRENLSGALGSINSVDHTAQYIIDEMDNG